MTPAHRSGFTLVELLVGATVLTILAGVAVQVSQGAWRREKVQAAALEMIGWLEEVATSSQQLGTACTVTVTTGSALAPGVAVASVSPTTCARESSLRLPSLHQSGSFAVGSSLATPSWSFTPRGSITTNNAAGGVVSSTATDISIRFSVDGQPPLRCVRLSGTLGLLRLGRDNSSATTTAECSEWSRN